MPGDPLALGRCLDQHARRLASPEHLGEPGARGENTALDQFSIVRQNAELTLAFVEI
jgi:hypothetical protein